MRWPLTSWSCWEPWARRKAAWAAAPLAGETPVVNIHNDYIIRSDIIRSNYIINMCSFCVFVCGTYSLQEHWCLVIVVVDHTELCIIIDNIRATEEISKSWWRHGVHQLEEQQTLNKSSSFSSHLSSTKLTLLKSSVLLLDTNLMQSVVRHKGQEGGQVGELESHEWPLQEIVEIVVVVVTVALERYWSWSEGEWKRSAIKQTSIKSAKLKWRL